MSANGNFMNRYSVTIGLFLTTKELQSCPYSSAGCRVFKWWCTKLESFHLKINMPTGNYWILRIGVMRRCQKRRNLTFKVNFVCYEMIRIFLNFLFCQKSSESHFFSMKNINLGAHFLLFSFFYYLSFLTPLFSNLKPNFWHLLITPILKIQ